MLTIIDTKGKMQHLPVPKQKNQLEVLQAAVGGYIEPITMLSGKIMWVNEEGLLKKLPHNPTASIIAQRLIVGVVVLTDKGDIK